MSPQKSLSLSGRFKLPHPPLPDPGRLMRLLSPTILILFSTVDRAGNQLTMSNTLTTQLVSHNLPGLTFMTSQQTLEKLLSRNTISPCLKIHINHVTILIYRVP